MHRARPNHADSSDSEGEDGAGATTGPATVTRATDPGKAEGGVPAATDGAEDMPEESRPTPSGLTEAGLDAIEDQVAAGIKQRVNTTDRVKDLDLYGELNLWRERLEPYDWRNITPKLMNAVLAKVNLAKGFNRQKQVRMYELLRCLGSDIKELELSAENPADLERIKAHFRKHRVEKEDYWLREEDTIRVDLNQYFRDARGPPLPPQARTVIKELGYSLQEVKSTKVRLYILGAHVIDLLRRGGRISETAALCNTPANGVGDDGSRAQSSELCLRELATKALNEEIKEQDIFAARTDMCRFLQDVAEDFHRKSKAWQRHLDDEGGRSRVGREPLSLSDQKLPEAVRQQLMKFTPVAHGAPATNLHELAPNEIRFVLQNVVSAFKYQNRPKDVPKRLADWHTRTESDDIGIGQYEELARDLGNWFSANAKAMAIRAEATVPAAVSRALAQCDERGLNRREGLGSGGNSMENKETVKDHVIAIFGASRVEGQRLPVSGSPVIVHRVPFNLSGEEGGSTTDVSSQLEIRELGVRLEGSYVEFTPESGGVQLAGDADGKNTELRYFEWVPPGIVEESSKPLFRLLEDGVTHVRLVLPNVEDDDPVEVSLRDPTECKGDSLTYKLIPSKPRDAAVVSETPGVGSCGGGGFRRFVLQVGRDLNISLPEALRQGDGTGGAGFVETGAIVAQALRIFLGQRQSLEDITQHLHDAPDLLYYTSIALLESVSPNAREVVKIHWERELRLDSPEVGRMSIPEREAREVLRDLLVAREAGRDKLCGIVPEAHCAEIVRLLTITKHALRFMSVESSNLDSRLVEIDALLTDSVICILVVTVTGHIDPAQIAQIIHRARGCVRIVFVNYPSLLPSLALNQLINRVIVPPSLEGHCTERVRPVYYSRASAVGSVMHWSQEEFITDPEALRKHAQPSISAFEAELRERFAWKKAVEAWRWCAVHSDPLLLLLTPEERHMEKHFLHGFKGSGKTFLFDDSSLPQMEKLLARHTIQRGDELETSGSESPPVIVLSRIFFVKLDILEALVKECFLKGFKLILVLKELLPDLLRVGVRAPGALHRQYVTAKLVKARVAAGDLSAFADHPSAKATMPIFRALALALGPEVVHGEFADKLVKADKAHSLEDVVLDVSPKHAVELRELVQGMLRERDSLSTGLHDGEGSLSFRIGQFLLAVVQQTEQEASDITFPEFSRLPVCGLLPQMHRVEAWLRYLAAPLQHCPLPELLGKKHVIVERWPPTLNIHGSYLPDFLHGIASTAVGQEIPPPAYVGTGRLDVAMSRDALYERCAMQGRDLDWELFAERWTHAYDLTSNVMGRMLRFSPDIGRLILCMPPSQIVNLNALMGEKEINLRILAHFEQIHSLVTASESSGSFESSSLTKRRAAFAWVLRNSPFPEVRESMQQLCGPISQAELDTLVDSHIMLRAGEDPETLLRVAELLVRLDGDVQLLSKQAEVRDFLLRTGTEQLTEMLWRTQIGAVFIHFLLSAHVRADMLQGRAGGAIMKIPFFSELLLWAAGRGTSMTMGPQLTDLALAAVIELAPKVTVLPAAAHLLWEHARKLTDPDSDPDTLISKVVAVTAERSPYSVVPVLEALVDCDGAAHLELKQLENPLVAALWNALRSADLGIFLSVFDASSSGARLPLSLDGSPRLRDLYLQHFAGKNSDADLEMHHVLLTDPGSSALYTVMLGLPDAKLREHRLLLWHCWARAPDRLLPYRVLPQASDRQLFVKVLRNVDFWERCSRASALSVIARFLVEPFSLPLRVFNTVAGSLDWVHGGEITERMLLVGQEGHKEWVPYLLRFHERPLPQTLLQQIMQYEPKVSVPPGDGLNMKEYPRVSEGVSVELVQHNIRVLFGMRNMRHAKHETGVQRSFLGATILSWFGAAGMSKEDVFVCVSPESRDTFEELWNVLLEDFRDIKLRKAFVHGPIPAHIEVHWNVAAASVPLLNVTKESADETAQWANLLKTSYDLPLAEVHAEDLVVQLSDHERDVKEGPRLKGLVAELARDIANNLKQKALPGSPGSGALVIQHATNKFDSSKLVDYMSIVTTFSARLRGIGHQHYDKRFLQELVRGLSGMDTFTSASIFDAFFVLYSVTPLNFGREVGILAEEYKKQGFKASRQARDEARWMNTHYYDKFIKDQEIIRTCQLLHSVDSCDWERTCPDCDFIGELLLHFQVPAFQESFEFRPLFRGSGEERAADEQGEPGMPTAGAAADKSGMRRGANYDAGPAFQGYNDIEEPEEVYFVAAGAEEQRAEALRQLPLVSLPTGTKSVALVAAPQLLKIDYSESMYMHGVLRVRPGLQPLLRDDEDESFYRLAPIGPKGGERKKRKKKETGIVKAFPNNGDAWDYLNTLPAHSVIMCEGFYVVKADNPEILLPVLAGKHARREHGNTMSEEVLLDQRTFIWPMVHSHRLVRLDDEVLIVLRIIVYVAWRLTERSEDYLREKSPEGTAEETAAAQEPGGEPRPAPTTGVEDFASCTEPSDAEVRACLDQIVQRTLVGESRATSRQAMRQVRTLRTYHNHEKALRKLLVETMHILQEGSHDIVEHTLREVCYSSAGRPDSIGVHRPFIDQHAGGVSPLGARLSHLLSSIMTQNNSRSAVVLVQALRVGEHDRVVVPHHHLTKLSAARHATEALRGIEKSTAPPRVVPSWTEFSDSEDSDGEGAFGIDNPALDRQQTTTAAVGEREVPLFHEAADNERAYVDSQMDRDGTRGAALLPDSGFGRCVTSRYAVLSFYDADVPLYFVPLSKRDMQLSYSMADGLPLGFLLHKNLIFRLLTDAQGSGASTDVAAMMSLREKILNWLVDVLRSPLSDIMKRWILEKTEKKGLTATQPPQDPEHVNLAVIAFCLCRCCPSDTPSTRKLREMLSKSWQIPRSIRLFIERKSDLFGIYIVKGGTLTDLRALGLHVASLDFERVVAHGSLTNAAMYLEIVRQFSDYCCVVYIQGLVRIQDQLLKWLAEYTRHHPWRFVYLENVDVSWNYSENRDRCNFVFAPPNPAHVIQSAEDLKSPHVTELRPSHVVAYDTELLPPADALSNPEDLPRFFRDAFARQGEDAPELLYDLPPPSNYLGDFRSALRSYVLRTQPCLVLLVSPPGAGKTYFMAELQAQLARDQAIGIEEFDGSSDILVHHTLAELLNRAVTARVGMLIVDEYHMLSDEHKEELYAWLQDKLSVLRVVLIANRIDSRDRERLRACQRLRHEDDSTPEQNRTVVLLEARLTRTMANEVMEKRSNTQHVREAVGKWLVASRLIFGEESISLRIIDQLDRILSGDAAQAHARLVELLLNKVPTISRVSAEDYVGAFLNSTSQRNPAGNEGPFATLVRVALVDEADELCSLLEFLQRTPRAYDALPSVRLLAWASYVLHAAQVTKGKVDKNIALSCILGAEFVDQVGVPFQLRDAGGKGAHGYAFTWSGDYSSLEGLIDAVKHGHSIDWADVGEKEWSRNPVSDGEALCRLLSSTRNPSKLLGHLSAANLASLLRCSTARVANTLARYIIKNRSHIGTPGAENPFYLAVWTLLRHDPTITTAAGLIHLVDGDGAAQPVEMLHALQWAQQYAQDQVQTTCEPRQRHLLLQRCLVAVTTRLLAEQGSSSLWSGPFARLLLMPAPHQETGLLEPRRLTTFALYNVFLELSALSASWRPAIQVFWRLLQGCATGMDVNELWRSEPFLFFCSEEGEKKGMPAKVVEGCLKVTSGQLEADLQTALLTTGSEFPDAVQLPQLASMLATAIRNVRPRELDIQSSEAMRTAIRKVLESDGVWAPHTD